MSKKITEFLLIKNYFSKLTDGFSGALNLLDDCGYIKGKNNNDYVVTLDTICEGVHFPKNFPPEYIANRLIVPNLSDLASSGARPLYFLMTGNITQKQNAEWYKNFTKQIAKLQKKYGFSLLGGDTVKTKNDDIFLSATFIGEVKSGRQLTRLAAKAGNDIYVSGKIGGGYLGLQAALTSNPLPMGEDVLVSENFFELNKTGEGNTNYLKYYTTPTPRLKLGGELASIATSCTDISDGLVKDLGNICSASKLSAVIYKGKIPLMIKDKLFAEQITGGDDYELIFTAPKDRELIIKVISMKTKTRITKIGEMVNGKKNDVKILDKNLKEIKLKYKGWEH